VSLQRFNSVQLHDTFMIDDALRTNSHSSFDSNFFAFNRWEIYTQKKVLNTYNIYYFNFKT